MTQAPEHLTAGTSGTGCASTALLPQASVGRRSSSECVRPARRRGLSLALGLAAWVLAAPTAFGLQDPPGGAPTGAVGNQDEGPVPPIQAAGDTYVLNFAQGEDDEAMSLYQFAVACERVTDFEFTWSEDVEGLLKNSRVRLIGTKTIDRNRFYSFFQVMMIISQFVCTEIGEDDIAVVNIESLVGAQRSNLRAGAVYVEPSELETYADQPATLITTVVTLPNTDVRQVSNSMRTMITDANTQQMLPAGNSNSMVLVGFGSNVVAMANMLKIIDEASKLEVPEPVFDMVKLEYTSAEEIQPIIEELLEAENQNRQNANPAAAQQGGLGRNRGESKIIVAPRLNALLITALPDQMPRIQELIAQLDVDIVERERSYHIYELKNVGAEEIAETLNEFLEAAVNLDPTGPGGGGNVARGGQAPRSSSNSREFVVVPEPETNTLLIAANRTLYQELEAYIDELDRRQDQVLIETALIELTGRDFLDIGVELGFADIPGADETGGVGVTSFGLSTLVDSDGDGVVDLRQPNIAQGVTAGILDGDDFSIPMLLALLETKQNSNVLNVPSVLVNNNSEATVSTLDEQPTTQITAVGGTGVGGQTQENFAGYEEAGITMQISPSISASRYLRMGIYLEVSTFIGTVQGAIPPPRVTRTIETQVNVPDGSTMVIGGIVVDNEAETRNQVPLLGDIPLLGRLFSRETSSRDRTVLYFFVTPHILHDKDFADLAEISYRSKLELVDNIGIDRLRTGSIRTSGSRTHRARPVSLEGFDLPLYESPPMRGESSTAPKSGSTPKEAAETVDDERRPNDE